MSSMPYGMNFDPHPDIFPNYYYRRIHSKFGHPSSMHPMGLITVVAPNIRENGKCKDDLAHVSAKGVYKDKDHDFIVHIDVGYFLPEEINVKIVKDHIIVEGKHEEREADDTGFVSRHIVRRYELPKDHNADDIVCKLSSDGVLSLMLPKSTDDPKERIIPIQQTGPNDLFLKHKTENGEKDKTKNGEEKE